MTVRYGKADAIAAHNRLCAAVGKRVGTSWNDHGAWNLAREYAGYQVQEPIPPGGGVTLPMGEECRSAREYVTAVRFAVRALEAAREGNREIAYQHFCGPQDATGNPRRLWVFYTARGHVSRVVDESFDGRAAVMNLDLPELPEVKISATEYRVWLKVDGVNGQ